MMWGVSGPMSQLLFATDHVSVHWLIASKMILAGIIVVAGGFLTQKDKMLGIWRSWHTILALLAFTAVGMVSMQFIYYQAIAVSDAATATILQFMSPILVVVYLAFAEHKLPSRIDMSAVVLAILGTYLIVTRGHIGHLAVTPVGLFWGIAAAFAAAVYTLGPRRVRRDFHGGLVHAHWRHRHGPDRAGSGMDPASQHAGLAGLSLYPDFWDSDCLCDVLGQSAFYQCHGGQCPGFLRTPRRGNPFRGDV